MLIINDQICQICRIRALTTLMLQIVWHIDPFLMTRLMKEGYPTHGIDNNIMSVNTL